MVVEVFILLRLMLIFDVRSFLFFEGIHEKNKKLAAEGKAHEPL